MTKGLFSFYLLRRPFAQGNMKRILVPTLFFLLLSHWSFSAPPSEENLPFIPRNPLAEMMSNAKDFMTNITEEVMSPIKRIVNKITFKVSEAAKNTADTVRGAASKIFLTRDYSQVANQTEERGNLDSFGRKVISKARETIDKLGFGDPGLDTNTTISGGTLSKFMDYVKAIYPGTKWCGDGDKARTYSDLGPFKELDSCCREHDLCPDSIPTGKEKHGLKNSGLFTRSHCNCDTQFYNCLKNVEDALATNIGFTYFSILGPQCFKEEHKVAGCKVVENGRCIVYKFDEQSEKATQWFDNPRF